MAMGKFGKDRAAKSSESFISGALTGGNGPSEGIHEKSIGRGQKINTAVGMDNVDLVMKVESSILDEGGFKGGKDDLSHSLTGTSAVQEKV